MKQLYGFLIRDRSLTEFSNSQKTEDVMVRHLVRHAYYTKLDNYNEVARREEKIFGRRPDHTTIINSVQKIKDFIDE